MTKTGLATSTAYQVRYRARNQFGWSSSYSAIATISTITEPGQIDASTVTITVVGTNVEVVWSAPSTNGSPVLGYEILFASTAELDPTFVEELEYCDGRDTTIRTDTACTIPMSQFWESTASSLNLVQGDQITIKIRAWNAVGLGHYSEEVDGPVVTTPPETPTLAPERDEDTTTTTQIGIVLPEITAGSDAAGSTTISSYNLEWNQGSGTAFYEIVGESTENLDTTLVVDSLTEG